MTHVEEFSDISEMVNYVCEQPPKPPGSFQIEPRDTFHTELPPDLPSDTFHTHLQHEIFRRLGEFLTHMIVYLFGEGINVKQLTAGELSCLQAYMHSLGWEAVINPESADKYPNALPWMLVIPCSRNKNDCVRVVFQPLPGAQTPCCAE
jgi:hypothetical protein